MYEQQNKNEKYISIEYDAWFNKYKPMAEENELLAAQLADKEIQVFLRSFGYYDHRAKIADVGFSVASGGYYIEGLDRRTIEKAIEAELGYTPDIKKEIEKTNQRIDNIEKRLKGIPQIVRWIFRLNL